MQDKEVLLVTGGAWLLQSTALWFVSAPTSPAFSFFLYPVSLLSSVELGKLGTGTEVVFLIGAVRAVWHKALLLLGGLTWLSVCIRALRGV